jgi:hypothetical protein
MRYILEYIYVGGFTPGYKWVKYFNERYFRIYLCRGLHALVIGRLNILMRGILEYIYVGGLHALFIGGLNIL